METPLSPETRFSSRVADYVRYRPGYPEQVIQLLEREIGLSPESVVADVGAGTGISTAMFLRFGCEVLIWNERRLDSTPFLRDYEALLIRFGTDYEMVRHENIELKSLGRFFRGAFTTHEFPNSQHFNFESLKGRLLSSSYAPGPGHPDHEPMLAELRRVYEAHQSAGLVDLDYITKVHVGV